jgi:hypothetical protein
MWSERQDEGIMLLYSGKLTVSKQNHAVGLG